MSLTTLDLSEIFKNSSHSLTYFSQKEIDKILSGIFDKGGKPYLKCLASVKDRPAKPEELVRQLWIRRLHFHYGYELNRFRIEHPITFGRDTSKKADIVVMDADRPTTEYLIVEVKAAKLTDGRDQLKSYCHAKGAPLALWSNGTNAQAYYRKNPNYFIDLSDIPSVDQTIEDILQKPWTLDTLVEFEKRRQPARLLKDIILDMQNDVLANAGVDVFEEVFKLIFTKLFDELEMFRERCKMLRFRNTNTATDVYNRIQKLFEQAQKEWPGVFPKNDKIRLTPDHLQVCVGSLEEYKLFNSNLDVIDDAFEYLVGQTARGEKGQYFTPRWVIDMCVKMLNPKEGETMIDPACGSSGFTMHTIFKVWREIIQDEGLAISHLFTLQKKPYRCDKYVQNNVFGIDFDEKVVRVARCLNLIAGDGQSNVLHLNTLDWNHWNETVKRDPWTDTYFSGWKKFRTLQENEDSYKSFGFDVLMANPPFAGDIKQGDMLALYEMGKKANGKLESAVGRDLLFIERNLELLRPGGRMAIVLPQGRLNNASDKHVRDFIADQCRILAVVGLNPNTFKPHTGTKTSVLFVQKWNGDTSEPGYYCPRTEDYNIFFATQQVPSKNSRGDKIIATDSSGKQLQDEHGHWIIQHDLFKHDGLTDDGIAEAFAEFAIKEQLSFF